MKHKSKKEIVEWALIIGVIGIVYLGGWHSEVIGRMQQAMLSTGVIQPKVEENGKQMSYSFTLEDLDGNQVDFETLKGEVIFINFWATWCPPCIAEMPDIHRLYESEKEEIKFVMISLDRDEKKAKAFIKKKNFEFPTYFLRSSLPNSYDTHAIPTTYILDREGNVHVENHGMAKYNTQKMKNLLSKLVEGE